MPEIAITIVGHGDGPPWEDVAARVKVKTTVDRAAVLQGGMVTGRTSIALLVPLDDGTFAVAETSAALLRGVVAAIDGAEERWGER